jgi:hypothetical protein
VNRRVLLSYPRQDASRQEAPVRELAAPVEGLDVADGSRAAGRQELEPNSEVERVEPEQPVVIRKLKELNPSSRSFGS